MSELVPVQYHSKNYPKGIVATIHEVAAHFDKASISTKGKYSLHTEISYNPVILDFRQDVHVPGEILLYQDMLE